MTMSLPMIIRAISWTISGLILAIYFYEAQEMTLNHISFLTWSITVSILGLFLNSVMFYVLHHARNNLMKSSDTIWSAGWSILIHIVGLLVLLLTTLKASEIIFSTPLIIPEYYFSFWVKMIVLVTFLTICYYLLEYAIKSYRSYYGEKLSSVKQDQHHLDHQLELLKSQLSPHFLFNGLNTITSLAAIGPEETISYVRQMGQCYRSCLEIINRELIKVSEEMEFVQAYLGLAKTRYPKSFKVHLEIEPSLLKAKLPPLAIQTCVENIFKHNQVNPHNPLEIHIYSKDHAICIKNSIKFKGAPSISTRIGLSNLKERYRLLQLPDIKVEKNLHFFNINLPVQ